MPPNKWRNERWKARLKEQSWDNNESTFTHREIGILYVLLSVDLLLLEVVTPEIKTDLKYPRHSNLHCHHDSDCIIYKQVI